MARADSDAKPPSSEADHGETGQHPRKPLSPAAERALAEAAARRAERERAEAERAVGKPAAKEVGGRDGPEPTRYGDWEVKGIATDF